jgi:Zn-dependent peptidase ImmA (M78 family)
VVDHILPRRTSLLREYLGIPLEEQLAWRSKEVAFSHWRDALESAGVFVFKDAFRQDEISGFCLYDQHFPLIYINNSLAWARQVFTLFHELAHLMFRTGGIDKVRDDYIEHLRATDRRIEVFCNALAAAFLVPDNDFEKRIGRAPVDEKRIGKLSNLYSVSREVVLRKLLDRERVSQSDYERLSARWIEEARRSRGRSKGGDYYATQRTYLSNTYLNLALGAYYTSAIDIHRLADLLNMRVDTAREFESRL